MALLYANKVSQAFVAKIIGISQELPATVPDWLMFAMNLETGGTFSPSIKNPKSSATGLIQFLSSTAQWLGTSIEELRQMTAEEQLDWVYEYMKRRQQRYGRFASYHDVYLAILYPEAIGKPDDYQLDADASLGNLGFDVNKDKIVTVGEIKQKLDEKVRKEVPEQYWDTFFKKKSSGNCINAKLFGEALRLVA